MSSQFEFCVLQKSMSKHNWPLACLLASACRFSPLIRARWLKSQFNDPFHTKTPSFEVFMRNDLTVLHKTGLGIKPVTNIVPICGWRVWNPWLCARLSRVLYNKIVEKRDFYQPDSQLFIVHSSTQPSLVDKLSVCMFSKPKNNKPLFPVTRRENQCDSCEQIRGWRGTRLQSCNC